MSHTDELRIANFLNEAQWCMTHAEEKEENKTIAKECIEKADTLMKQNIRDTFINLSSDTIINFAEIALTVPDCDKYSEQYIDLFFQRNQQKGQMFVRAKLLKAKITTLNGHHQLLKGEQMIQNLQDALQHVKQALDIISKPENKQKYAFLIYNTSLCIYNIIRQMIKKSWIKNFTDFVERIEKLFDEIEDPDHNWRCRYSWLLFQCLYDQDKKQDAFKVLDKLWNKTFDSKTGTGKTCNFQDHLFRLRIHLGKENASFQKQCQTDAASRDSQKGESKKWVILHILQQIKSGLIPEASVEKELKTVLTTMNESILLDTEVASSQTKLPVVLQERIAEAGRIALQYNQIVIADKITNFLKKVRQLSHKAYIMHEYNRAELFIKKAGPLIDAKTGMRLNSVQIKIQEVERRVEALKILEKVMSSANKKPYDAELIYDGAVLTWNMGLPFLNANHKQYVHKAFYHACQMLELIQSNDHELRMSFHLELAKIELYEFDLAQKAEKHIQKALQLDYSTPVSEIKSFKEHEDLSLYQRRYERYLVALRDKIKLKINIYQQPNDVLENVIVNLEQAQKTKSENLKIDILQKCLGSLVNLSLEEYKNDPLEDLVEEEIQERKIKYNQKVLYQQKQKKLLAAEIAKMAFEFELNELSTKACEFVLGDEWDPKNAEEMILSQVECCFIFAQITIDNLIKDNFEIAYKDPIRIYEDDEPENQKQEIGVEKRDEVKDKKQAIITYFKKGLDLAESINQSWLIFNGSIYIWNNYLPVFRNPGNDDKLLESVSGLLKEFYDKMKNSFKELEKKQIIDYDRDTKIQVNANIGIIYARLLEGSKQFSEVLAVCDGLLQLPLGSHTRKLINSIKARVSEKLKQSGGQKQAVQAKGGKPGQDTGSQGTNSTELVVLEVVSMLEIIQNSPSNQQTNKSQEIIRCFDTLEKWVAKPNDETELEMHAEFWARLARLALNEEKNPLMHQYALRCVEHSLKLLPQNTDIQTIPASRLRWYSLAEYLYSETLMLMLNPDTQETESQEQLLFHALKHAVEGANKGLKADINYLVLDASKMVWNICAKLQQSAVNRKDLIKPIYSTILYLKSCKEKSETDLILLLSQLMFKACLENEEFQIGENICDMCFELIPKDQQKPVWEAKMIFMSKLGKNELQAISNMKEADASLQAKVWIRLARASNNTFKQCQAYEKAIEILKKESSVEIVEVYIEFAEWLLRNGYELKDVVDNLFTASDILVDIEIDNDEDEDEEPEKGSTIFSRNSRGKKSKISKGTKNKSNIGAKSKKSVIQSVSKSNKTKEQKRGGKATSSRMEKTSQRSNKTAKSKSKSIFTQKEENPQPETLNCAHYERLMRIHSMLALIAETQEEQIQYCLEAKLFLTKIFDISFQTLNQKQMSAAMNDIQLDKDKKKDQKEPEKSDMTFQVPKYKIPTNIEEWVKLSFSPEFLDKVKTHEDYDFIGKFIFDKAEITFTYVEKIINILMNIGLHVHCVPLMVFQRFFAKEIIGNTLLGSLWDIKFSRLLHLLGYHEEAKNHYKGVNLEKLKLTEHELKRELARTESSKVVANTKKSVDVSDSYVHKPNLVKEIQPYMVWLEFGKEFYVLGDLIRARELLTEAYRHAKILNETEVLGEIHLYLASICYLEGDYQESLENHMMSHKFIKNTQIWYQKNFNPLRETSAQETFKTLKKLNKFDDIQNFLKKMIEVYNQYFIQIIFLSMLTKPNSQSKKLNIHQILVTLHLLNAKCQFKLMRKDFSIEMFKQGQQSLDLAKHHIKLGGSKKIHYDIYYTFLFKLQVFVENNLNYTNLIDLDKAQKILTRQIKSLQELEDQIKKLLKYSLLIEKELECSKTPLMLYFCNTRIMLASAYSTIGIVKSIKKRMKMKGQQINDDKDQEDEDQEQEKKDLVENLPTSEPLKTYILKLSAKIENMTQLVPHRFQSFERAIALLTSCENKIPADSYLKYVCKIELQRARRLQAEQKQQMKDIWERDQQESESDKENEQKNVQELFNYKEDSLNCTIQLSKFQQNLQNYVEQKQSRYYTKTFCINHVENFGKNSEETTFEYLAKFQHQDYSQFLINQILKSAFQGRHKFVTHQRLIKHVLLNSQQIHQEAKIALEAKDFKLQDTLNNMPEYQDIVKNCLPSASAYLILKFSDDLRYLYVGYMQINKEREFKFYVKKKTMKLKDHEKLDDLKMKLNDMKKDLIKTPIISETEYQKLESVQDKIYDSIMNELEEFSKFFSRKIHEFVNIPTKVVQQEVDVQVDKKGQVITKKDDKKQGKKGGGKDELTSYESPLGASKGGIESIVLLIDTNLFNLPFEKLKVFQEVPAVSRDFSLLLLGKRYKNIGYKPELNNSTGINKNQMKYITYNFKKSDNLNAEPVIKQQNNMKFEGVVSSQRVASVGQWQKFLSSSQLLLFYGHPGLMNILTPKLFLDMCEISNTKVFIIMDKINANKSLLEKYQSLEEQSGQKTPLQQQLVKTAALLSILCCSSICLNQWSVQADQFPQMLDVQLKGLSSEIYFSSTMRNYKVFLFFKLYQEPQIVYSDKNGKILDMKLIEQSRQQRQQPVDNKKSSKKLENFEEIKEEDIIEKQIQKKQLWIQNAIFVGVPVIRLI